MFRVAINFFQISTITECMNDRNQELAHSTNNRNVVKNVILAAQPE